MEKCGCQHPCVPRSYPHAGYGSARCGLVPPSAWCAQEIQIWLGPPGCGNVCLYYGCGYGSSRRGYRHRLGQNVRTLGLLDSGRGNRHRLGVNERILGRPDPGGGCRHQTGQDERTRGLPDPRGGYRQRSGVDERTLDLLDPGGGCRLLRNVGGEEMWVRRNGSSSGGAVTAAPPGVICPW